MNENSNLDQMQASRLDFLKEGSSANRHFRWLLIFTICFTMVELIFGGALFQALACLLGLFTILAYMYQRNCEARADVYTVGVLLVEDQNRRVLEIARTQIMRDEAG